MKSLSQLSISQEDVKTKKVKYLTNETILSGIHINIQSSGDELILYKPSKYLRMPRRLLLHLLRLQLNYTLQKKNEQKFILARLQLMDQQFCLEQIHYLYQTYANLGLQHQTWLVNYK